VLSTATKTLWHKEQTMRIKWGNHLPEPIHVTTGFRQGGAMSPHLLAVYLDDQSIEQNNIKLGVILVNSY